MYCRPSATMRPQSGVPGSDPKPIKRSAAVVRMMALRSSVAWTTMDSARWAGRAAAAPHDAALHAAGTDAHRRAIGHHGLSARRACLSGGGVAVMRATAFRITSAGCRSVVRTARISATQRSRSRSRIVPIDPLRPTPRPVGKARRRRIQYPSGSVRYVHVFVRRVSAAVRIRKPG